MDMETQETTKASTNWAPIVGLVATVAVLGAIGYAVARSRAVPEPEPVVQVAPEPKPVYVDIRSLAAADLKRMEAEPTTEPATQPATDEIPGEVAKGTGVIAVKKGGKAKVAKVAAVADKPPDPDYANRVPHPGYDGSGGSYRGGSPRVYGEETPEERWFRLQREENNRNRPQPGVTPRESRGGYRNTVGGIR